MSYEKEPQMAEMVSEDSDVEDVNFWPQDMIENLKKENRGNRSSLDILNRELGSGYPKGLRVCKRRCRLNGRSPESRLSAPRCGRTG